MCLTAQNLPITFVYDVVVYTAFDVIKWLSLESHMHRVVKMKALQASLREDIFGVVCKHAQGKVFLCCTSVCMPSVHVYIWLRVLLCCIYFWRGSCFDYRAFILLSRCDIFNYCK